VIAEGEREDAPIGGPDGLAYLQLTLGAFQTGGEKRHRIDVWIEDPVPDYGAAKSTLVVAATRTRHGAVIAEERLAWLLLGPGSFVAGTTLLLVLLLMSAFRWRLRRAPERRRRTVDLSSVADGPTSS
jgi:hypothetical protein